MYFRFLFLYFFLFTPKVNSWILRFDLLFLERFGLNPGINIKLGNSKNKSLRFGKSIIKSEGFNAKSVKAFYECMKSALR